MRAVRDRDAGPRPVRLPPGGLAGADRPQRAAGAEVTELAQGLLVRPAGPGPGRPGRPRRLNNTASVVWDMSDGQHTVLQIAADLAAAFGLDRLALAEVTGCVEDLHRAGLLIDPVHHDNESRDT